MRLLALIALFLAVPFAELYVIIKVADGIGTPWTIVLLALDSLLGAWLMRSQGRAVWRRFNETLRAGRVPRREILDGALVIFGGAFLITPGFLTDVIGLLLLLPPTRALIRPLVLKRLGRRFTIETNGRAPRSYDVEGTASDYEPDVPRRRRIER